MPKSRWIFALLALAATIPQEREAGACSCSGPGLTLLSPDRVDDAPLNATVRLDVPTGMTASLTLRESASGRAIATTSRTMTPGGWVSTVELVPAQPLEPGAQYEVATTDAKRFPPVTVIGTFRTGKTVDKTAPRITNIGASPAYRTVPGSGGMCQINALWAIIEDVAAEDPGRPSATIVYGVWLGDAAGTVDPRKPPTAILTALDGKLYVGRTSLCDPHGFPVPESSPVMWLGLAALDEAGNMSPIRKVRVDLSSARHP